MVYVFIIFIYKGMMPTLTLVKVSSSSFLKLEAGGWSFELGKLVGFG